MASFTDLIENRVCELVVGKTAVTLPTIHLALFTAAPTDAGGGTEVTGGAYARVATAAANWGAASGGTISNTAVFTFPTPTASWGTVVAVAGMSAATLGDMWWYVAFTGQAVGTGNTVSFAAGALTVSGT